MSIDAVNHFLQKVNEEPELQGELSQAQDDRAIVEVAAKWGYEFTESELSEQTQALQSLLQRQATGKLSGDELGELSEDELLAVAGGVQALAEGTNCCGSTATSHLAE